MHTRLVQFISTLRDHDIRISTAESLDAMRALALVGYDDRQLLKASLATALTKTIEEKQRFDHCFELFYSQQSSEADNQQDELEQPAFDLQAEIDADPAIQKILEHPLTEALALDKQDLLSVLMAQASAEVNFEHLRHFTQIAHFSRRLTLQLGLEQLDASIEHLQQLDTPAATHMAYVLRQRKPMLRQKARDKAQEQYVLTADAEGKQLQEQVMRTTKLTSLENRHYRELQALVRKLAKKLAARHSRRQYQLQRGKLDVAKTLRKNIHLDGILFETHWKRKRKDQPKLIALCDVSGSVETYARFLLMFLYSLSEVLPRVRSFCFSNCSGEVTDLFDRLPVAEATDQAFKLWGQGASDYGRSLTDFAHASESQIDSNTTIIILGDGRNNHGDAKLEVLQRIYHRAKTIIWLNPERRSSWDSGDSEMRRYQTACHFVAECQTLQQLERNIDQVLRLIR